MRLSSLIVALAVSSVLVLSVAAQNAYPARLFWSGFGCQGAPLVNASALPMDFDLGKCSAIQGFPNSSFVYDCGFNVFTETSYGGRKCNAHIADASHVAGRCVNFGDSSSAVVCSPSQPILPPVTVEGPVPGDGFVSAGRRCNNTGCDAGTPYMTTYEDSACAVPLSRQEVFRGLQLDKCHNFENAINVQAVCDRGNSLTIRQFSSGCTQNQLFTSTTYSDACVQFFDGEKIRSMKYMCNSQKSRALNFPQLFGQRATLAVSLIEQIQNNTRLSPMSYLQHLNTTRPWNALKQL